MKLALLGYGKMGKAIEKIAVNRGHEIVLKVDADNLGDRTPEQLSKADAAIEFTTPATARENIMACFQAGVPVVVGTTGWYQHFDDLAETCIRDKQALFYATNFSIGVNIFFHINKILAGIMNTREEYDVQIEEVHHTQKLDAPSGTAITAAEGIAEAIARKTGWESHLLPAAPPAADTPSAGQDKITITSVRKDNIPGTHTVTYGSEVDAIELKHTAFSRTGFATGAVAAAEWVRDKKGVFTMKDMLDFNE